MDINAIKRDGLASTASAITAGQQRFDAAAAQVVADTTADSSDQQQAVQGQLATDVAQLSQERMVNSILYSVFQRQQENQQDLTRLISPR